MNAGSPDPDAPYRVPFASVSRAIRGVVPAGGVDWYALELDRPTALTLWLLTPMVDACDGFSPVMRIVDGAHDVTDVGAWDGRRWFEATSIVTRLAGSVRIEATLYVSRAGHKAILIGEGGARIKSIGARARRNLAELLERPVHLFLFVKVRESWGDDPERYRAMGLEFPKE